MGLFNGLTKEEDAMIAWLVKVMEESYAQGLKKVNIKRENVFKAIFTRKVSTSTWNNGDIKTAIIESLTENIEFLSENELIYESYRPMIMSSLKEELINISNTHEQILLELCKNWHYINSGVSVNFITECGKKKYTKYFTNCLKNFKENI